MDELQEKIAQITSDQEARYFAHFTPVEGVKILDEGLITATKEWRESFLELTEIELDDIIGFLNDSALGRIKNYHTLIIAAVYSDCMNKFFRKLEYGEVSDIDFSSDVGYPDYIVDSEHLLCAIDLDSLEVTLNEKSNVLSNNMYL